MEQTFSIQAKDYEIEVGNNALKVLSQFLRRRKYSSIFILCDENTFVNCLPTLVTACASLADAQIIETEAGETTKSLEVSANILQTLIDNNADKNTLLVNLGGGMISDLGGFNASIYKRGIHFINIPTSLLAMADASVGGKTGIDFGGLKNSVGTFSQPQAVFIYPGFLKTLPQRHYKNGLAEIYKMALVADKTFWKSLSNLKDGDTEQLIARSVTLKNNIVKKDPFDKGLRKILNFGHTIGHALESLLLGTKDELLHGEAIVAGMLMESHIAYQKKLITKPVFEEISGILSSAFTLSRIHEIAIEKIIDQIRNDKKNSGKNFLFALPTQIGKCSFDVAVTETQIKTAFSFYNCMHK